VADNDDSDKNEEPIVHDKRRIDPETGKVRRSPDSEAAAGADTAPAGAGESAGAEGSAAEEGYEGPDVETSLSDADLDFLSGQASAEELAAERLVDLQRVTAEYANYRKRTEANREVERERAVADTAPTSTAISRATERS
jgi:molecular chaperone GrpE